MNTLIGDTRLILELAFVTHLAGILLGMLLDGMLTMLARWFHRPRRRRRIACPICHRLKIISRN